MSIQDLQSKIRHIHRGDLREWVKAEILLILLDFGQTVAPEDATHMVDRITDEVGKKLDWSLSEVRAAFDSGKKGQFGKQYSKVTVIRVLDWLNEQSRIREKRYIVQATQKPVASAETAKPLSPVGAMFFEAQHLSRQFNVSIRVFPPLKDLVAIKQNDGQHALEELIRTLSRESCNSKPENALL